MDQDHKDREESEDAEATFANIGAALVGIQTVEHLIGIALLYVYRQAIEKAYANYFQHWHSINPCLHGRSVNCGRR
jgi:hypothetical protein